MHRTIMDVHPTLEAMQRLADQYRHLRSPVHPEDIHHHRMLLLELKLCTLSMEQALQRLDSTQAMGMPNFSSYIPT